MKFLVCERQESPGCDYTIGCGMRYGFIDAENIDDAIQKTVFPDGPDELPTFLWDGGMAEILIVQIDASTSYSWVDIDSLKAQHDEAESEEKRKATEVNERALLDKLRKKYA